MMSLLVLMLCECAGVVVDVYVVTIVAVIVDADVVGCCC